MFLVLQVAWLVLLGLIEAFATQWQPVGPSLRRRARNLTFTVVNHVVVPPVSVLAVHFLLPIAGVHLIGGLPIVVGLISAIVIFDFAGYWFHRVSHRNLFLWRFHQIHHLDEDFDFTTGARVHTVEETLHQMILVGISLALGIPSSYLAAFATVSFAMALFHHSNVAIPSGAERYLRLLVFTPALHVPHHHERIDDTDTNFGFIFPWWDRMFGSYNARSRQADWRIGLDYSADLGVVRLFLQPFRLRQLKETAAPLMTPESTAGAKRS